MTSSGELARRSLLLLPPAPSPPTYAAVKAAYHATLFTVLRELSHSTDISSGKQILEIAVTCPHLYGHESLPRAALYATTQSLVANLYKLITIASTKEGISTQDAESIDARIILVSYPRNGHLNHVHEGEPTHDPHGPIVSLPTLARSRRAWASVFSVQCEAGDQLLEQFTNLCSGKVDAPVSRVRGGTFQVTEGADTVSSAETFCKHYDVAVGGTWDHLHIGHKLLLTMTLFAVDDAASADGSQERTLTCGITGDQLLVNKKHADFLESWSDRQKGVWGFYQSLVDFSPPGTSSISAKEVLDPGPNGHAINIKLPTGLVIKCVEIWDPFGPTITDERISALILSAETRAGGKAVNVKRAEKQWAGLEILEVDVLDAEEASGDEEQQKALDQTFQGKLSSTEIRRELSERAQTRSRV